MSKPFAITLDSASSRANHTGSWRVRRPVYVTRQSPCDHACPAGEQPQAWLALAEEGNYRDAWEMLVRDNPLPAVMGRACYHPCETACNRGKLDAPVSIHAVERFLGDLAIREGWSLPAPGKPTGKSVLVIGGGPAGLSAAYQLALARTLRHAARLRARAGRHDALRNSQLPAPARGTGARSSRASSVSASAWRPVRT